MEENTLPKILEQLELSLDRIRVLNTELDKAHVIKGRCLALCTTIGVDPDTTLPKLEFPKEADQPKVLILTNTYLFHTTCGTF